MAVVIKELEKELRHAITSAILLCVLSGTDISPFHYEIGGKKNTLLL
jgi:hypothetical protein